MDEQTDARQSDPYVPLCFAGDRKSGKWHISIYWNLLSPLRNIFKQKSCFFLNYLSVAVRGLGIFMSNTANHNFCCSDSGVYFLKEFISPSHLSDVHPAFISRHFQVALYQLDLILMTPLVTKEHLRGFWVIYRLVSYYTLCGNKMKKNILLTWGKCVHQVWSKYTQHCDLDLWPLTSKMNVWNKSANFNENAHNGLKAFIMC